MIDVLAANQAWLWLGGSLLLAVLWSNVAWHFRKPRPGRLGETVHRLETGRFSPWLHQGLQLIYYVGIPYAAFILGRDALVERYLGIRVAGLDESAWLVWMRDLAWAVSLSGGTCSLLAIGWAVYRKAAGVRHPPAQPLFYPPIDTWSYLIPAIYHEIHWTFYRNAPIVGLGTYWGVWIGLALAGVEAALNPAWRHGLRHRNQAPALLMRWSMAILSALLFLKTGNLWLTLASHWLVSWGLAALTRALPIGGARSEEGLPQSPRAPSPGR